MKNKNTPSSQETDFGKRLKRFGYIYILAQIFKYLICPVLLYVFGRSLLATIACVFFEISFALLKRAINKKEHHEQKNDTL